MEEFQPELLLRRSLTRGTAPCAERRRASSFSTKIDGHFPRKKFRGKHAATFQNHLGFIGRASFRFIQDPGSGGWPSFKLPRPAAV